ncbi:MAG: CRISPR-associated endonuclease Cas1, partial [Blastocatellia bacterium]
MSGDWYTRLCRPLQLRAAWGRVEESDGCAGIDGVTLERFEDHLEAELERLRAELVRETYAPLPLLQFTVPKANGGERLLAVPAVRDRVAQQAAMAVMEPAFEAEFEACSFAYRRGRSVEQALAEVERLREAGYEWVIDADISSYFDNVDHALLLAAVRELVTDPRMVGLVARWIGAMVYDGQQIKKLEKGLPQGAPISPMLANLFLDRFDERMLRDGQKLVRYADDFLVLCRSQPRAEEALQLTSDLLAGLRLALHSEKTRVTSFTEGFKFLGATFIGSFCLRPARRQKENRNDGETAIRLPPPLPILRLSGRPSALFNPGLRDGLRQALLNPANQVVPTGFQKVRDVPSEGPLQAHPRPPLVPQKVETQMSGPDADLSPDLPSPQEGGGQGTPSLVTLRTLYLQDHGVVLRCEDDHLRVTREGEELLNLPSFKIDQIMLMGNGMITTPAMKYCLRNDIPIVLLSGSGQFEGVIESTANQNVLLQKRQFERSGDEGFALEMARRHVTGKLINSRALLQRRGRSSPDQRIDRAVSALQNVLSDLALASTIPQIRGYEGAGSADYFKGLAACFRGPFVWQGRIRRPPPDPLNAMLSFGYTMLFQNIYAIARARGLTPYVGALHELRQGHPALCSDLIEEFRAPVVDALVTTLVNKRLLTPAD